MTTQTQTDSNMNNTNYLGSMMLILGGAVVFFLLVLGSLTDNRFGTHMVLNSNLSSGPEWYLLLISVISMAVVALGVTLIVLDRHNIFKLNDSRERTLITGSLFLMGSAAFVLALSSISFAAFNWQFFESQIKDGTAEAAIAMMTLSIIGITASLAYIVFGLIVPINSNEKLYLTLRNTSVALVALGWLVFNLCINSFGSMGGDANVLVAGLTGKENLLENLGTFLLNEGDSWTTIDAKTFYQTYLESAIVEQIGGMGKWLTAQTVFNGLWNNGILNIPTKDPIIIPLPLETIIHTLGENHEWLSKDLLELSTGKEGMIMGVNNSFNSQAIFTILLACGFVGLPLYAGLTYPGTEKDKKSIMLIGSVIVIISMTIIYLFLALTPYMVSYDIATQHRSLIELLFKGEFDPSIAPGLIALPGEPGGIHSAVVYFSDEYAGTIVWWTSEVLTFVTPVVAFVGATLLVKLGK